MPILAWGMAPALAAGNTVVAKPAELTPLTAIRIGELALEAGLPEGVFQVLPGKGSVVGQRLVDHPDVRKIVFTGSTEVGRQIMAGCARQVKRVTLELGGKSANIVFADADLERAAATAPYAVFDNAGPGLLRPVPDPGAALACSTGSWSCSSPRSRSVAVGDPAAPGTEMGPLISAAHRAARRVLRARRRAGRVPRQRARRARVLVPAHRARAGRRRRPGLHRGGVRAGGHRRRRSRTRRTRSRSPTTRPTACPGRSGPRDVGRAIRVARAVETGNLSVNSHSSVRYWTPFGGFKQSGLGRELGPGRAGRVHRDQERLHRHRMSTDDEREHRHAAPAGPGRGDHRGRQRHRPGQRAQARGRGGHGRGRRHRRGGGQGGRRGGRRPVHRGRRDQRGRRAAAVRDGGARSTGASTSRSTTRASPRRRTTRSCPPAWTPGAGSRRST